MRESGTRTYVFAAGVRLVVRERWDDTRDDIMPTARFLLVQDRPRGRVWIWDGDGGLLAAYRAADVIGWWEMKGE